MYLIWGVSVLGPFSQVPQFRISSSAHLVPYILAPSKLGGFKFSPRESKAVSGRGRPTPSLSLLVTIIFAGSIVQRQPRRRVLVADKSLSLIISVSLGKNRARFVPSCYYIPIRQWPHRHLPAAGDGHPDRPPWRPAAPFSSACRRSAACFARTPWNRHRRPMLPR